MPETNPCMDCGACCACFRASFYWGEADDCPPGGVPVGMTADLTDFRRVMRGTDQKEPRCIALMGTVGTRVHCAIYDRRSSICRSFQPSWAEDIPNEWCDRARLAWSLPPLTPDIWTAPRDFPKAA